MYNKIMDNGSTLSISLIVFDTVKWSMDNYKLSEILPPKTQFVIELTH